MNRARLLADRLAKLKKRRRGGFVQPLLAFVDGDAVDWRDDNYTQREGEPVEDCLSRVKAEYLEELGLKEEDLDGPILMVVRYIDHDTHP